MRKTIAIAVCLITAGCATNTPAASQYMSPVQAVLAAAERPVSGTFLMEVRATGRDRSQAFLNSEDDYRDQRCLTIEVPPPVEAELKARLGGDLTTLKGKKVRITGTAQRVKVWFLVDGVRTEKFYYQTHVKLSSSSQIVVL